MTLPLIRVVIVEDQPHERDDAALLVQRLEGFAVVGTSGTVAHAKALIPEVKPDVLILDIHLPDGTGFDVLRETPGSFKVIFLTGFEQHAIQAIKYGAFDYLVKPLVEAELTEALIRVSQYLPTQAAQISIARHYHKSGERNKLVLRSQDYLQVVEIDQIVYCHSDHGYTTFHLRDGRSVLVAKILKDYEEILAEPTFLRPHQSYCINSHYIDRYNKDGIILLKNGAEIPVSTRRRESVIAYFNSL